MAEADVQMALSECTPEPLTALSLCTPEPHTMVSQCTLGEPTQAIADQSQPPSTPQGITARAAMERATREASERFGWHRLKRFQCLAVEAWARGVNSFIISGTGSGKSACFTLPALVARRWHELDTDNYHGPPPTAIVVCPLVSLMRDQVSRLQKVGVIAAIDSPQCDNDSQKVWARALAGEIEVLYTSPERLYNLACAGEVSKLPRVSLLAIDEAHCVSEWGVSFRQEYGRLKSVVQDIAQAGWGGRPPPVLCLTATCPRDVRRHVLSSLGLEEHSTQYIDGSMNRPNLHYSVEDCGSKSRMQKRLLELLAAPENRADVQKRRDMPLTLHLPTPYSPTLVYANTKEDVDRLAAMLDEWGIRCYPYHSGSPRELKEEAAKAFQEGSIQVIVATIAFGMGIDKPDVRRVIHFGLPGSLENYAQESGRAGRDGKEAECILLYEDSIRNHRERAILGKEPNPRGPCVRSLARLQSVIHYCHNRGVCRRAQLLQYLGEDPLGGDELVCSQLPQRGALGWCEQQFDVVYCGRCDVCVRKGGSEGVDVRDARTELQTVLSIVRKQAGILRNKLLEQDELQKHRALTKEAWQRLLDAAVHNGLLTVTCFISRPVVAYAGGACSTEGQGFQVDFGNTLSHDSVGLPKWIAPVPTPPKEAATRRGSSISEKPQTSNSSSSSGTNGVREKQDKSGGKGGKAVKRKAPAQEHTLTSPKSDGEGFATPPLPSKRALAGGRRSHSEDIANSLASIASPARQRAAGPAISGSSSSVSGQMHPAASSHEPLLPCPGLGVQVAVQASRPAPRVDRADPPANNTGERRKQTRSRRGYTEADRNAALPYIAKLMEAADFKTNVSGGAARYRTLMAEAKKLAPGEQHAAIEAVPFLSKTPGVHAQALDALIARIRGATTVLELD